MRKCSTNITPCSYYFRFGSDQINTCFRRMTLIAVRSRKWREERQVVERPGGCYWNGPGRRGWGPGPRQWGWRGRVDLVSFERQNQDTIDTNWVGGIQRRKGAKVKDFGRSLKAPWTKPAPRHFLIAEIHKQRWGKEVPQGLNMSSCHSLALALFILTLSLSFPLSIKISKNI